MGIWVMFWMGSEDGIVSHFLSGPLAQFEQWAKECDTAGPGEIVSKDTLTLIPHVRAHGAAALRATDSLQATCIDHVLDTYYGNFCDLQIVPDVVMMADRSTLYLRRYESAVRILKRAPHPRETRRLWEFLLNGRPVLRDPKALPYKSEDGVFRLSYWTLAECVFLQGELSSIAKDPPRSDADQALAVARRALSKATTAAVGLIITVS